MRLAGTATATFGQQLDRAAAAGGKVTSSLTGARSAVQGADAAAKALASDLARAAAAGGKAAGEMRLAGTATASFGQQLDRAAAAGGRITSNLSGAKGAIQGASGAAKALAADLDRAAAAAGRTSAAAAKARGASAGGAPVAVAAGGGRPSGRPEPRFARGGSGAAEPAPSGGGGAILLGQGPVNAFLGYQAAKAVAQHTVGPAVEFEKAWAEVQKKVNDAPNPGAMGDLEKSVRRMGIELGIPRAQMAELVAEAGAAGIKFQDLERFTRLAAKASVAWDMTPREASQKLAEIKAGTGATISQMETLGDKINTLGDNSAAKERDIVEMFGRSAAAAKEAGVSYDASLAVLTAVRSAGMQPEIVSRWFNAFTSGLRTISEKKKPAQEALKELGLNAKEIEQGMQRDSLGTINKIFSALEKSPNAVKAATTLFGKEWWDETMRAKSTGPEIKKMSDLVQDPSRTRGSMQSSLNIQLATTANHLERLKSLSTEVGQRLGQWALPHINKDVQGLVGLLDQLDRRARVKAAGQGEPRSDDDLPLDLKIENWLKHRAQAAAGAVADRVLGKDATVDPQRQFAAERIGRANDLDRLVKDVLTPEESQLDAQLKKAKGEQRKIIEEKLADVRRRIAEARDTGKSSRAAAGPAAGRDMTDVEVGEAAAKRIIEERRARGERIAELEKRAETHRRAGRRVPARLTSEIARERERLAANRREGEKSAIETKTPDDKGSFQPEGARAPFAPLARDGGAAGPTAFMPRDFKPSAPSATVPPAPKATAPQAPVSAPLPPTRPAEIGPALSTVEPAASAAAAGLREVAAAAKPPRPSADVSKPMPPVSPAARWGVNGPTAAPGAEKGVSGTGGGAKFPLSLDLSQPVAEMAKVRSAAQQDLSAAATTSMAGYAAAITSGAGKAVQAAQSAAAQIKSALSFNVSPTITPRISAPVGGGGGAATPATGGGGKASAPAATPARAQGGGGNVVIQSASFHGVNDPKALQREVSRFADARVRGARGDALHDVGGYA